MANPAQRPSHPAARVFYSLMLVGVVFLASSDRSVSRDLDVPYVPTPQAVVDKMLEMAEVKSGDVLIDLGSGDGRIPITAAKKFDVKASGVDLNPVRVAEAKQNAEKEGVSDKVEFRQEDLFKTDLSKADVITMYLLTRVNMELRPSLMKLKPGTRIVSHAFRMGDWQPDKTAKVEGRDIYMWVVRKNMPVRTNAQAPAAAN